VFRQHTTRINMKEQWKPLNGSRLMVQRETDYNNWLITKRKWKTFIGYERVNWHKFDQIKIIHDPMSGGELLEIRVLDNNLLDTFCS
jgi:hypothetical protein